jgi:predicted HicB family RNase H-like nuclease
LTFASLCEIVNHINREEKNVSDTYAAEGRRPGRPPKDENEKRVPLSLRITPDLRSALEAAAKDENRSLTQLSEFALASFLEARKHGGASKDVSPAAAPPSVEKQGAAARMVRLNHHQRDPIDVFGRAFGRDVTALMLLIGLLVKYNLYHSKYKNAEPRLTDPEVLVEVTESVITLLRLIGPEEQPELFGTISNLLWRGEPLAAPWGQWGVAMVAGELAFDFGWWEYLDPWGPVIRDWLGEAVIARIRQRLSDPSEGQKG